MATTSPFGAIDSPLKNTGYSDLAGGGLIMFISNIIKLVTIGAGLFAFINLIIAGFGYISAGNDAKKTTEAWAKIYMSLIGLIVIVSSYTLAAIIGWVLFKDPTAILSPKIYGPGATSGQ
jgi:hypothetical protein